MTTSINQTLNNPFASSGSGGAPASAGIANSTGGAWGTSYSTTGTGSVVLNTNPTFSGNISANVNLRSDTLTNLLALAGGVSEIASPTDSNYLVKYNGVAGGAVTVGGGGGSNIKYVTLTDAMITNNTVIDCNGVDTLYITFDPNGSVSFSTLNLKLPAQTSATNPILQLKVILSGNFISYVPPITVNLSYQAIDITNGANVYVPVIGDGLGATKPTTYYNPSSAATFGNAFVLTFVAIAGTGQAWTRLPMVGETSFANGYPLTNFIGVGQQIGSTSPTTALTSGTLANCGSISLPAGMWLVTSVAYLTVSTSPALVASSIACGACLATSTTNPTSATNTLFTQVNGALSTPINMPLPTQIIYVSNNPTATVYYQNAKATFSAGTISVAIASRATRIA